MESVRAKSAVQDTGDAAYRAPAALDAPLPELPPRPSIDPKFYPDCREDYQAIAAPFDRAADTNRCTGVIDGYYQGTMLPYRRAMIAYQQQLSALYAEKVGGNMRYSAKRQSEFFTKIMEEHANADPDGDHQAAYRGLEARYQTDRAYLADRFCFNTGCNGYPVPVQPLSVPAHNAAVAASPPPSTGREKVIKRGKEQVASDADAKCKRKKKRGGGLGGFIGSVAGQAAGLGNLGSAVSGLFGSVLVGAIACQLDEKEQKVAAEATVALTEKEAVGATASWASPTREGVGGTSTITALNTEPNGDRCMSITDIAIIDGEETRVAKRMCRKKPGEPYAIMA